MYKLHVRINEFGQLNELNSLANAHVCVYVVVLTSVWIYEFSRNA